MIEPQRLHSGNHQPEGTERVSLPDISLHLPNKRLCAGWSDRLTIMIDPVFAAWCRD